MRMLHWGSGIGVAAFALGVSLAGPQIATAVADTGEAAVSAGAPAATPSPARGSRPTGSPSPAARTGRSGPVSTTIPAAARSYPTVRTAVSGPSSKADIDKSSPTLLLASAQGDLGRSLNKLRDLTQRLLPPQAADVVNGGLFLVRRLLLPTGADVGLFGDAACVRTGNCVGKDLTGVQLDDQDLAGIRFDGATLTQANLRGANLSNAEFGPVELPWLFARTAAASRTANQTTPSCNPNCEGANLELGAYKRADLEGADLESANLSEANLTSANLTNANLTNANMYGTALVGATLTNAIMVDTNLTYASLTNALATGVNLTGATLTAGLIGANLTGANLTDTNGTNADMTGTNLSYTNMTDAIMINANMSGADLYGANLTGTNLTGAALDGAILSQVTWSATTCPNGTVSSTACSVAMD